MAIDKVVIFCSPKDAYLAEICVASIRYWNSDIPLFLHKDESKKRFDTSKIEKAFDVGLVDSSNSSVGNPMSKFYYITKGADIKPEGERILVQDADTAWFGNVAKILQDTNADFVFQGEMNPDPSWIRRKYFDPAYFQEQNPASQLPKFVFNSGHFLVNTNTFSFDESDGLLTDDKRDTIPPLFLYDQGLFNYIHAVRSSRGTIRSESIEFAIWSSHKVDLDALNEKPKIVHWAGKVHPLETRMEYCSEILRYRKHFLNAQPYPILAHVLHFLFTTPKKFTIYYLKQFRLRLLQKDQFYRK
jgi:hypothetical protein